MLPYIAAFFVGLWWCARARNKRQLYLFSAYVLVRAGVAGQGAGRASRCRASCSSSTSCSPGAGATSIFKLEIPRGVVLFVAAAFPWYHAMLIRHGCGVLERVHRRQLRAPRRRAPRRSRHLRVLPAVDRLRHVPVVGHRHARRRCCRSRGCASRSRARGLAGFALVWFLVEFTMVSLVNTKFHHYILPALPALAILAGLFLDELLTAPTRSHGDRRSRSSPCRSRSCPGAIWRRFRRASCGCSTTTTWCPASGGPGRRRRSMVSTTSMGARCSGSRSPPPPPRSRSWSRRIGRSRRSRASPRRSVAGGCSPPPPRSPPASAPVPGPIAARRRSSRPMRGWCRSRSSQPAVIALALSAGRGSASRPAWLAAWLAVAVACVSGAFMGDKMMIELSPHWSQKHVIAAYYALRRDASEPLVAWELYWRGENFYTRNQIYASADPGERTVFLAAGASRREAAGLLHRAPRAPRLLSRRARQASSRCAPRCPPARARPCPWSTRATTSSIYCPRRIESAAAGPARAPQCGRQQHHCEHHYSPSIAGRAAARRRAAGDRAGELARAGLGHENDACTVSSPLGS